MDALRNAMAKAQADVMALQADPSFQAGMDRQAESERREAESTALKRWRGQVARLAPVRAAREVWSCSTTPATEAVIKWLEGGCSYHLVLRGGIGCGKTTAACLAVKHWCQPKLPLAAGDDVREPDVSWLTPDGLVTAALHAYDVNAPKLRKLIVVDDMGRERVLHEFDEALCRVLDLAEHTLLITTNLTREEMRGRYDKRLIDRLCHTAQAVDLPGHSMRRKNPSF